MTGVTEFTQKGKRLTVTASKLEHQRRQIRRRDARKQHDATGDNVPYAGESYTYSDVRRAIKAANEKFER